LLFISLVFLCLKMYMFTFIKWPWMHGPWIIPRQDIRIPEISSRVKNLQMEIKKLTRRYKEVLSNEKHKKTVPHGCRQPHKLLVMVQSHPPNLNRRNVIRSTWGHDCLCSSKNRLRLVFMIGWPQNTSQAKLIEKEQQVHGDILPLNSMDNFQNATNLLQNGMRWVWKHCAFEYLLKATDDTFVNTVSLFQYLGKKKTPKEELYTGKVYWWNEVRRSGKHAISKEYKRDYYPRYCSGSAYVLSRDVVRRFVGKFDDVPSLTEEDAYLGEVALKTGITTVENEMFKIEMKKCRYKNSYISYNPITKSSCMIDMYNKMLRLTTKNRISCMNKGTKCERT